MNQGFKLKSYKGYTGTVNAEVEMGYYWGAISDVPMPIEYEADTLQDLQEVFEDAVEEYIRIAGIDELMNINVGER